MRYATRNAIHRGFRDPWRRGSAGDRCGGKVGLALAGLLCLAAIAPLHAQQPAPDPKPDVGTSEPLATQQRQLADRFKRLEEVLLRMAELSGATDPRRATLLKKAVAQSKERLIALQFEQLVKLLDKDQLSQAIENQVDLQTDLKGLLELLLSENRSKRIESEKARLSAYLKRINQLIREQRGVQGRTGGDQDPKSLSPEQARLAEKTGELGKDMKAFEEESKPGAESQAEKPQPMPSETPSPEPQPGQPGPPPANGPQPKSGQPGQPPSPPNEPPQPGQMEQGPAGQQPERPPARQRVVAAEQRMRQAQQKLEQAERKGAAEEQEQAIRELQQAKAELEEILRQLREEEMDRVLALLEARFLKMLQLQREVLEGTVRLDKVPEADRTHNHEIESGRLSTREVEIVVEADKALLLLREDGTALAFAEAVVQMRQDMQQVVQRLAEGKVSNVTQSVEEEIVAALEEMIESLKKAQKKLEDQRQRQQPQQGEPSDPPLVDALAELKMIRALQVRINNRTQRYTKLISGEQADSAELRDAIRQLAERQERIYQITRDLELGKNR